MNARTFLRISAFTATCAALAAPTFAADKIDINAGKTLHDQQCKACHVQRWGGDGSAVYTRPDRKIKDASALRQRVAMCSTQTSAKFFPEDEANVSAYLAQQFYKFK
jgi:mono/diheme cytochrome c family protein